MTRTTPQTEAQPTRDISHWPDLQYHFGLSFAELLRMPNGVRKIYEKALPRLLAEDQARQLDVIAFPHMKKEGQRKLLRRIERARNDGKKEEAEVITDGAKYTDTVLTHGISIEAVDAEGNVIENVGASGYS